MKVCCALVRWLACIAESLGADFGVCHCRVMSLIKLTLVYIPQVPTGGHKLACIPETL